jgi:hypothetical protein
MNTDKLSGDLFPELMRLLDIKITSDREDVACAFLDESEMIDLEPEPEDDGRYYVYASDEDNNTGSCDFATEAEATKFIDALIFLGNADELAGENT